YIPAIQQHLSGHDDVFTHDGIAHEPAGLFKGTPAVSGERVGTRDGPDTINRYGSHTAELGDGPVIKQPCMGFRRSSTPVRQLAAIRHPYGRVIKIPDNGGDSIRRRRN